MSGVLVLNHHGMGDALMALPACRWLVRESGVRVTSTVQWPWIGDLLRVEGCTHEWVQFQRKARLKAAWTMARLRLEGQGSLLALYGYSGGDVAFMARALGISAVSAAKEGTEDLNDRHTRHKVLRHLDVVAGFLGKTPPAGQERDLLLHDMDTTVATAIGEQGPYVVFIPGSGEAERYKRWPIPHFADFGSRLLSYRPKLQIFVTGAASEYDLAETLRNAIASPRVHNISGTLSIRQTAGLFASARFVIGGDSGGLHLARAAGGRVVGIFGPTNAALTGPFEADLIVDRRLPGTPWYSRETCIARAYSDPDESMTIEGADVIEQIIQRGLLS